MSSQLISLTATPRFPALTSETLLGQLSGSISSRASARDAKASLRRTEVAVAIVRAENIDEEGPQYPPAFHAVYTNGEFARRRKYVEDQKVKASGPIRGSYKTRKADKAAELREKVAASAPSD
jgi:hypothetical protein